MRLTMLPLFIPQSLYTRICYMVGEIYSGTRNVTKETESGENGKVARLLEIIMFLIIKKPCRCAQSIRVKILMDFKKY